MLGSLPGPLVDMLHCWGLYQGCRWACANAGDSPGMLTGMHQCCACKMILLLLKISLWILVGMHQCWESYQGFCWACAKKSSAQVLHQLTGGFWTRIKAFGLPVVKAVTWVRKCVSCFPDAPRKKRISACTLHFPFLALATCHFCNFTCESGAKKPSVMFSRMRQS